MTVQKDRSASLEADEETITRSLDEIRADIAVTRRELGDTVDALASKMDVRSRAKDVMADAKDRFSHAAEPMADGVKRNRMPMIIGVFGAIAAMVLAWRGFRR